MDVSAAVKILAFKHKHRPLEIQRKLFRLRKKPSVNYRLKKIRKCLSLYADPVGNQKVPDFKLLCDDFNIYVNELFQKFRFADVCENDCFLIFFGIAAAFGDNAFDSAAAPAKVYW